jgi:glutamyl-tRNA reductase
MTDIILIGLNHNTAPVALRECVALVPAEIETTLKAFKESAVIDEVVIFSTCNRMEVLLATPDQEKAVKEVKKYIVALKQLEATDFEKALYVYSGDAAVAHVFKVAASLDSMMVGEPQILGQIKNAYHLATEHKASGTILNRLLHRTFFVAKRIRSETGIGDRAVSISYAAIELGRKIFGTFDDKKVLLIGAGEMAELAVEHLIQNRAGDILVANRTFERGFNLAKRFKGSAIHYEELEDTLTTVDIIISSTGSPDFILTPPQVKKALKSRRNRPLFFIDIAVPRDIDPAINRLSNAYVYDIDDLKGVIDDNLEDRRREAVKAERIADEAVITFRKWYQSLDVVPTIVALRSKMETIAKSELKKTFQSLDHLSADDHKALARMTEALINKFLHDPTVLLKGKDDHRDKSAYVDTVRILFKLDSN